MSTLLQWLKDSGKLRQGRRTPETIYASFDNNLDDRSTNFPVTLVQDVDLGGFIIDAVNEKLERGRCENIDPEAWLADQLAQLSALPDVSVMVRDGWGMTPESAEFQAVQKLAQEYGEMCAARALGSPEVVEHAEAFKGGDMKVRSSHPETETAYPVEKWVADQKKFHGKVYRRKIVVLEDWSEIT